MAQDTRDFGNASLEEFINRPKPIDEDKKDETTPSETLLRWLKDSVSAIEPFDGRIRNVRR